MALDNRRSKFIKRVDRYLGIPLIVLCALARFVLAPVLKRKRAAKRVLAIKLSALGDTVLLTPALYRLRETFLDSEIVFLGTNSNEKIARYLSERTNLINRFESFSASTVFKLWREKFDVVIDFEQWMRATAIVSAFCRARAVFGFKSAGQGRHFAYDSALALDFKSHMAENFWKLAAQACAARDDSFEHDKRSVRAKWAPALAGARTEPAGHFIVFHPGCGENGVFREWPLGSWAELARKFLASDPGLTILVTGSGDYEKGLALELEKAGARSMVGQLPFPELLTTLAAAEKVFVPNTGIMHLADFVNDYVVCLSGPTKSSLWRPLWMGKTMTSHLACAPCLTWGHDYGCSDPVCMKVISPENVFKAAHA